MEAAGATLSSVAGLLTGLAPDLERPALPRRDRPSDAPSSRPRTTSRGCGRTSRPRRRFTCDAHEDKREHVRHLAGTPEFKRFTRERRKVEMLFAHLKRNLSLRRLRLRGSTGAGDEFLPAATAENLRRLARNLAATPPAGASASA